MDTTDAPQIIEHIQEGVTFTPYDAVGTVLHENGWARHISSWNGVPKVYELRQGELKVVKETEKKDGFKCGTFGASSLENRSIATGDFKGQLQIFDLQRLETPVFSVKAHESIINCMDGCGGLDVGNGAPEIVTGGRDGCVKARSSEGSCRL